MIECIEERNPRLYVRGPS